MLAKVFTSAVVGLNGELVEVEVDLSPGMPAFNVVGLPDKAVEEARERVRSAIRNSGCSFPGKRITVSLAPGDLKKEGPSYDLPIAVGILVASEQVLSDPEPALFLGELSLDGALRHTAGILPMVELAHRRGIRRVYVPQADAEEAALLNKGEVYGLSTLGQLVAHLRDEVPMKPYLSSSDPFSLDGEPEAGMDFQHVKGQEHVKRALEVAAAGAHNLVMMGPPGSGKTLLARCLPSILPRLTPDEALELTKIYSVTGRLPPDTPLLKHRPFRSPHYTISQAGLVGGGSRPRPGEITMSHLGVLFLDELPEFGQSDLEVLRQPLEDREVTIGRASGSLRFPANFMLIGAMNPCPCGFFGDPMKECACTPSMVSRYQRRISGPLLDRMDIFVEVPRVEYEKLTDEAAGEPSAGIRGRVEAARERQRTRFAGTNPSASSGRRLATNADMTPVEVRQHCQVEPDAQGLLRAAMQQLHLSARAFHRILKVARTIADLGGADGITAAHLAEAIQYRPRGWT